MTILEIATLITEKMGRSDTGSISICKSFIKRRYQMVYDSTLWLESLATAVEHVVDRDVTISSNPEVYYSGGSAAKLDRILAVNFSEADVETVTSITVSSGPDYVKYNMGDTSSWSADDDFFAYGFPDEVQGANGKKTIATVVDSTYLAVTQGGNFATSDGSYSITGWITADENPFIEVGVGEWWNHFRVDPAKLIEQDATTLIPDSFTHLPKDSSGNPRLRLIPGPSKEGLLHVLGKLAWTSPGDDDTPVIHGISNVLLAYVEGDMLERGRQYGKAQIKFQEAGSLLSSMREAQRNQFASDMQIIPEIYDDTARTVLNF